MSSFWSEMKDKATTNPFGGVSFTDPNGKMSFGSIIGGIQGIATGINNYFNAGKPVDYEPFDLRTFKSSFVGGKDRKDGTIARPAYFVVIIDPPKGLQTKNTQGSAQLSKLFTKRKDTINLPGKTVDVMPRVTYGPPRYIAKGMKYERISMSIIVSESMQEREFFTAWTEMMQPVTSDGIHDGDIAYFDDYRTTIQINVYDQDGSTPRLKLKIFDAVPTDITPIQLNWADASSVMRMQVSFAFSSYSEEYFEKGESDDKSLLGMARQFANDMRNMVTSIKNLRFNIKQQKQSLRDIRKGLKGGSGGGILDKIESLASAPAALMGGLNDSSFRLLDGSNSDSITGVANTAKNNFSKYF